MIPTKGAHILVEGVEKCFSHMNVLKGVNLRIQKGEFIAIVGKSGCGKSTLLRLLAGLEQHTKGFIHINGKPLKLLNKHARIMFQDGRLLPWKRVIDNICIGLPKNERAKALLALKNVGLEDRGGEWPSKLSGGQKQRVALARALVHNPDLLLLDEPLGQLDALTRLEMQDLIETLWLEKKFTAILVTHDVEEAVAISDRVILLENGIVSLDQPIDLPRPRKRTHPAFSIYVENILHRIMSRPIESKDYLKQNMKTIGG